MDAPSNEPVRRYLMEHANLISAIRLPSNTFTDMAGTEVGTDLIVLQKQTGKRVLQDHERRFIETHQEGHLQPTSNYYSEPGTQRIVHTMTKEDTNPYGQPARVYVHDKGAEGIARDLHAMLSEDMVQRTNLDFYRSHIVAPLQPSVVRVEQIKPSVETHPSNVPSISSFKKSSRRRKKDTSGMLDLFSQPNLPIEDTMAAPAPILSFEPRPYIIEGERPAHYTEGTMLVDRGQVGFLKNITRTRATFHPLDMASGQKMKAERYIFLRDAYERLYETESTTFEGNAALRQELNYAYNRFVNLYGDLNKKNNAKLILQDSDGRNILALERFVEGQKQLADIFDHPVAFSANDTMHVETANEALVLSINKFGKVNIGYMSRITGMKEAELLEQLDSRLYYVPYLKEYQIADQFIAGNVLEKCDRLREYLHDHPDDNRVVRSLAALEQAMPRQVPFEELDFNFGERWIPTGIYSDFATELFETPVSITLKENIDRFIISVPQKNANISDKYAVKTAVKTYDGIELLRNAVYNTAPTPMKNIGTYKEPKFVIDTEATQMCNRHIEMIRKEFNRWLCRQSQEFKDRLTHQYNRKFNAYVRPKFDGSYLTFPGLNLKALGIDELYASQKDAV